MATAAGRRRTDSLTSGASASSSWPGRPTPAPTRCAPGRELGRGGTRAGGLPCDCLVQWLTAPIAIGLDVVSYPRFRAVYRVDQTPSALAQLQTRQSGVWPQIHEGCANGRGASRSPDAPDCWGEPRTRQGRHLRRTDRPVPGPDRRHANRVRFDLWDRWSLGPCRRSRCPADRSPNGLGRTLVISHLAAAAFAGFAPLAGLLPEAVSSSGTLHASLTRVVSLVGGRGCPSLRVGRWQRR